MLVRDIVTSVRSLITNSLAKIPNQIDDRHAQVAEKHEDLKRHIRCPQPHCSLRSSLRFYQRDCTFFKGFRSCGWNHALFLGYLSEILLLPPRSPARVAVGLVVLAGAGFGLQYGYLRFRTRPLILFCCRKILGKKKKEVYLGHFD